jgi:hypothetical protein
MKKWDKMSFKKFIEYALRSSENKKIFEIKLKEEFFKKVEKQIYLNIQTYTFIIKEEYVRHIKNRHKEDLHLLECLPDILNDFDSVEKSIIRNTQTGRPEISLVFSKTMNDGVVRCVAVRIHKRKTLFLKTLYRKTL